MTKKKSVNQLTKLFKKSTITVVMAFLAFVIAELTTSIQFHEKVIPFSDQSIELYSNQAGDNLAELYVDTINNAKESVSFVIYAMTDPRIIEALKQKSETNVPVRIVCDAKASKGLSKQLPHATIVKRVGEALMHQKILVVDNKQILLGSANMTGESLNVHGNLILAFEHPVLADALTKKAQSMDDEGSSTPLLHTNTFAADQNLELWILPDDNNAVRRLIELIQSAQKTIKVAMFTWTRTDLTQELIEAAKRGVQVEAVVDRYSGKGASAKVVKMLGDAGIPVKLSTGQGLLHHKFAYIDDNILINGSANWTISAFKYNDDCFVVMYPLTENQKSKMDFLWARIQKESK
jgi:cardiolipin synthase A/B